MAASLFIMAGLAIFFVTAALTERFLPHVLDKLLRVLDIEGGEEEWES